MADASWKLPLRVALERLAGGVDAATEPLARTLPGAPDPWAARDAYVDVVIGATPPASSPTGWLGPTAGADATTAFARRHGGPALAALDVRELRLVLGAPARIETAGALRAAVRAARLIDGLAGTALERRLVADLRSSRPMGSGCWTPPLRPSVRPSRPA